MKSEFGLSVSSLARKKIKIKFIFVESSGQFGEFKFDYSLTVYSYIDMFMFEIFLFNKPPDFSYF